MDYASLTVEEIKRGFCLEEGRYTCNYCGQAFPSGQIFSVAGSLYDSEHAAARHIETEHGGNLTQLLSSETKYNTLTDIQKELLAHFYAGLPDGEIAEKMGISASTVRHQKFTFREKAKQAKLYLAVFENVFAGRAESGEDLIPIPNSAAYYDDRYIITEQERRRVLETAFDSLEPPRLKIFPAKEKKKVAVLTHIARQFERGKVYAEKDVKQILQPIFEDHAAIRRYLIMYGFMERAADGSGYWVAQ